LIARTPIESSGDSRTNGVKLNVRSPFLPSLFQGEGGPKGRKGVEGIGEHCLGE
jgi:hypothetical protein